MDWSQTNKKSGTANVHSVQQTKLQKTVKNLKKCWITLHETMLNNKPYHKNLKRHKNDKQSLQTITAKNNIALTCSTLALRVVITKINWTTNKHFVKTSTEPALIVIYKIFTKVINKIIRTNIINKSLGPRMRNKNSN